ncbi:G protein-coupled glucose receptor regulating Gpa2-domain-containing protein [Cyathus striatus]|nr:G protein-coupled glucose receptor regulating Gpa2-domain-containing protein [Cyathus striatus]
MTTVSGLPVVITSLNLVGSLSSFLGSAFIIITYVILPKRRHFRHVLILNLATSDCLNALNLSISGLYILIKRKGLSDGSACLANGFLGQFTVQATDCAILAIAVATVFTITSFQLQTPFVIWSTRKAILVTVAVWFLPTITSFIALGKGWYGPASGSWCWIVQYPRYLRYALTHGWRLLFIVIEISLYAYLHVFLKRHYQNMSKVMEAPKSQMTWSSFWKKAKLDNNEESSKNSEVILIVARDPEVAAKKSTSIDPRYRSIQRILLLNAYPLAYIILWIPGIVNRFIELTGHTSRVTQVLQASTQFVGLANALTYGWNESISKQLHKKLSTDDVIYREENTE